VRPTAATASVRGGTTSASGSRTSPRRVAELEAAGIPYVEAGSLDVRQIWLRDPTGAAVELQPDPAVQRDRVDAAFDDNAVVR